MRDVAEAYRDAELRMLRIVARRLERGLDSPGWADQRLAEIRVVERELAKVLNELAGKTPDEVLKAVQAAHALGSEAARAELGAAGFEALHVGAYSSPAAVLTMARAASNMLASTHVRILREAEDVYRACVSAEAAAALAGGSPTRLVAAQGVLDRFAEAGVRGFVDSAGRSWSLDSYAEMTIRSAVGQARIAGALDRYASNGRDLVWVNGVEEGCEMCAPFEGAVLSISGGGGYESVDEAIAAGLFHPNCTHELELYVEGLTDLSDVKHSDPELYAERQQQRYLERGVRMWKRRAAGALSGDARAKANGKVAEWQARLRQFTDETGRRRLYYREQIGKAH